MAPTCILLAEGRLLDSADCVSVLVGANSYSSSEHGGAGGAFNLSYIGVRPQTCDSCVTVRRLTAVLLAVFLTCAPSAHAQSLWPVSFQAGLGVGKGSTSGEYHNNSDGITGDLLLGIRARPLLRGGLAFALGIGMQGSGAIASICIARASGTGCIPGFPQFMVVSALGGWETARANLRVLAGPATVRGNASFAAAWLGRIDLATPPVSRIALTASFRGLIVPDYRGDSFRLRSMGLGIRIR